MGSQTAILLGSNCYGQKFLVKRDRYGCELNKRVFIGECSSLASRVHKEDSMMMCLVALNVEDVDSSNTLDDWEF